MKAVEIYFFCGIEVYRHVVVLTTNAHLCIKSQATVIQTNVTENYFLVLQTVILYMTDKWFKLYDPWIKF